MDIKKQMRDRAHHILKERDRHSLVSVELADLVIRHLLTPPAKGMLVTQVPSFRGKSKLKPHVVMIDDPMDNQVDEGLLDG